MSMCWNDNDNPWIFESTQILLQHSLRSQLSADWQQSELRNRQSRYTFKRSGGAKQHCQTWVSFSFSLLSYFLAFGLLKRKQVCTSCSLRATETMRQNDNYQPRKIFNVMHSVILKCLRAGREASKRLSDTYSCLYFTVLTSIYNKYSNAK